MMGAEATTSPRPVSIRSFHNHFIPNPRCSPLAPIKTHEMLPRPGLPTIALLSSSPGQATKVPSSMLTHCLSFTPLFSSFFPWLQHLHLPSCLKCSHIDELRQGFKTVEILELCNIKHEIWAQIQPYIYGPRVVHSFYLILFCCVVESREIAQKNLDSFDFLLRYFAKLLGAIRHCLSHIHHSSKAGKDELTTAFSFQQGFKIFI